MPLPIDADVVSLDRVRTNSADHGRTNDKAVLVDVTAFTIIIQRAYDLKRVTVDAEEVLLVEIRYVDVLRTQLTHRVESAVCVLLDLPKIREIELILVVIKRAKNSRAEVIVREQK